MDTAKYHRDILRCGPRNPSRRRFIRNCGRFGAGLGAGVLTPAVTFAAQDPISPVGADAEEVNRWLGEVGAGRAGTVVRIVTENTAPSAVIAELAMREFVPATGIRVQIERLPLERVFQKISFDVNSEIARYDLYYLDQSWISRFAEYVIDPRERYESRDELTMPGYDLEDFLPQLVDGISMYGKRMVGIPFDIPLFIMFYRRDVLEELGLEVPGSLDDYLRTVSEIQAAKAPRLYGTTGQMKGGHYSLNCEWTAWLWAHGGSIFDAEGLFTGGDERGLEALAYMKALHKRMPPHVDSWTWDGQAQSLLQGLAAVTITWGEIFPLLDDPHRSYVRGLFEAAPPPQAKLLRPPEECGFGEIPNIGHQGGSALAVARHSANADAAWIFLQWATSREVQTRASLLGGGGSPTRASVFDDPRIRDAARVQAGTTRHLDAVRWTIEHAMGSEPDFPSWPDLANGVIPLELGRFFSGEHASARAAMSAIQRTADSLTAPYRV